MSLAIQASAIKVPDVFECTGEIPADASDSEVVSLTRHAPERLLQFGFQPAKTIPEIPRWFMRRYGGPSCHVLDPFAGSGTTLLEAGRLGYRASWMDYHPLSRLQCRVKAGPIALEEFADDVDAVCEAAAVRGKPRATVDFSNRDFWFSEPARDGLERLLSSLRERGCDFERNALALALAVTVRQVADMDPGMILPSKRAKYSRRTLPVDPSDVIATFRRNAIDLLSALHQWTTLVRSSTIDAEPSGDDARAVSGSYDAIVTSPPYINAIDYVWASKFELHWLGLVHSNSERLKLYEQEIGTERVPRESYDACPKMGDRKLDSILAAIYRGEAYRASGNQNRLRASVVKNYFEAMSAHFKSAAMSLSRRGYYCMSVGETSTICGVEIPVADILRRIASSHGFEEIESFRLLLKNRRLNIPRNVDWARTIKHDAVIVFGRQ